MMNLLVAGAGKGIGKATADFAYQRGHKVIAVSRTETDLKGRPYKTLTLDLEKPESIALLGSYSSSMEAIINCTGTHPGGQEVNESWEYRVRNIIDQNVRPALHLYRAFLPAFRERKKGHFVHVSSAALDFFDESESGYCASKAALEAVVLSLQNGDKRTQVLHHAVRVSLTDTPLTRKVCPNITDWDKFYKGEEIALYLIDIVENPDNYPKTIVTPLYKPVRKIE